MERRSFLAVIAGLFASRALPVTPDVEALPVQSIPLMGSGALSFGARIPFSFETMINDDLAALKDTPALFGRHARWMEEKQAVTILSGERY